VVPGSDAGRAGEYVALGAHYDHVGVGVPVRGDSVYNGADDDGSGVAALLEIAERFSALPQAQRPARSLLFVWHTGEELGLLGSEAFTEKPTVPRDSIVAQLNVDMIGRNAPDSLYVVGSRRLATRLGDVVEAANRRQARPFRLGYALDDPAHPEHLYCRSDHYNYARFGIPVTFFTTGLHVDYHQPSDEPRTLDYAKLARVATLIGDIAGDLAAAPERLRRDRPLPPLGEPCT
jgi:Zn-dependent M28 family amino/carboxypeptidase